MSNRDALIGDCKEAQAVAKQIYSDTITIDDAQCLTDMLTEDMKWPRVEVVKGRYAIRQCGSIKDIYTNKPVMILNKPSVGTVIHELSHLSGRELSGFTAHLHNHVFKTAQRTMLTKWLGR